MSASSGGSQRSAPLGELSVARHVLRSGRFLRIFLFFARVFGFLNGFPGFFFRRLGFPPVFLSFWIKKVLFSSARVTVLLSRESRPCLSETKKQRVFCFPLPRE